MKYILLYIIALPCLLFAENYRKDINFNSDWRFINQENLNTSVHPVPLGKDYSYTDWESVTIPHTAKIEPLVIIKPWAGISWYQKEFIADSRWKNKKVFIHFEAVMQQADVWLNGKHLFTHKGGYLPFSIDLSKELVYGKSNSILVKTDNHDNPEILPGKPIADLDFCYFSGIYRNVWLTVTQALHITDAVSENKVASGGVHVWYPSVSKESAEIAVQTHIRNENSGSENFRLGFTLIDKKGKVVHSSTTEIQTLQAQSENAIKHNITLKQPLLWHPQHPNLYRLEIRVLQNNKFIDNQIVNIGIRKFEIKDSKLFVNDEPLLLVGTNRHQEYPYIGNALSDNAQYRDAFKIKEAGFNIVRLSHYPQSTAFMNACDELGLLTIAAIPGWQFVGNEIFTQNACKDARDLIRRDRNHASVVFWELSLNESGMKDDFMQQMVKIAAEESPESKLITCGWINRFYDVWIPARQHGKFPDYWKTYTGKMPLFTGEYGDWEYFAQDAGLNQAGYAGLKPNERSSRQLRGDGEKRLLQQAANFQEAHNDNRRNPHLGDANWLMFDYNRGYSPDIESSGIMDIFRLPKPTFYFYQSQAEKPILNIASYWNENSDFNAIRVYSNCDEVAIYLNNKLIERKKAAPGINADHLKHPPFIFDIKKFEKGELKAIGYKNNQEVVRNSVVTAGKPAGLKLSYDRSGKDLKADGADVVFVYATVLDEAGHPVHEAQIPVTFKVKGAGQLIGENPFKSEAGIATILVQSRSFQQSTLTIEAHAPGLKSAKMNVRVTR